MRYGDAAAFRQALEQRLRTRAAGDGARLARDRKRVAFDRVLARLVEAAPERWLLKGGFALDLRLSNRARTTRDVDIDWQAAEEELSDALIEAAALETGDFFTFEIERTGTPPERLGGSHRFRATAHLAGRQFETFLLDVGLPSDPVSEHDTLTTSDLLAFLPASTRLKFRPSRSSGRSPRSCTRSLVAMATTSRVPARETWSTSFS